jgi:hypothetical protein
MCWNWQVSLITWIIATISAIALFIRRKPYDITFGVLLLFYSSMQFWEFLMWRDQKCGKLNKLGTYGAYFALYSHVFAIGLGLCIEKKVFFPLILGIIFMGIAFILFFRQKFNCSQPTQGCRNLTWGFNPAFYLSVFVACMILALVYVKPFAKGMFVSSLFIISFIFSFLFVKRGGVASYWCFIAAAAGPLFILLN